MLKDGRLADVFGQDTVILVSAAALEPTTT